MAVGKLAVRPVAGKEDSVLRRVAIAAVVAVAAVGCAGQGSRPAVRLSAAARDPRTMVALLKIATVFNNDYDSGVYGRVWDRWDARSQAVISRADYIRRHTECPDSPQSVTVEDASRGPGGAWIVDYETGGVQLHDYWFYVGGRWVFDLVLSNPDSVRLYRLTPHQYVAELGCAHLPRSPVTAARSAGCCQRAAAALGWLLTVCCTADLLAPSRA